MKDDFYGKAYHTLRRYDVVPTRWEGIQSLLQPKDIYPKIPYDIEEYGFNESIDMTIENMMHDTTIYPFIIYPLSATGTWGTVDTYIIYNNE